jgi:cell division protein FtsB
VPTRQEVRRRRAQLTARAGLLAAAIVSVTLTLALPFKTWLAQRDAISSLEASNAAARHRVIELQHEREQWHDPSYIEKQAQTRLHYVMPGQTAYVVLGGHHASGKSASGRASAPKPWYTQLWTGG